MSNGGPVVVSKPEKKKSPENFEGLACHSYPRCGGCEFFSSCDLCGDLLCWYKSVEVGDEVLCLRCAAACRAVMGNEKIDSDHRAVFGKVLLLARGVDRRGSGGFCKVKRRVAVAPVDKP